MTAKKPNLLETRIDKYLTERFISNFEETPEDECLKEAKAIIRMVLDDRDLVFEEAKRYLSTRADKHFDKQEEETPGWFVSAYLEYLKQERLPRALERDVGRRIGEVATLAETILDMSKLVNKLAEMEIANEKD